MTCNLFGDILSDLGAQLAGGLGLAPSGNIIPGRYPYSSRCTVRRHKLPGRGLLIPWARYWRPRCFATTLGGAMWGRHCEGRFALLFGHIAQPAISEVLIPRTRLAIGSWLCQRVLRGWRIAILIGKGRAERPSRSPHTRNAPSRKPPMCAHQATPPWSDSPKLPTPLKNWITNQ